MSTVMLFIRTSGIGRNHLRKLCFRIRELRCKPGCKSVSEVPVLARGAVGKLVSSGMNGRFPDLENELYNISLWSLNKETRRMWLREDLGTPMVLQQTDAMLSFMHALNSLKAKSARGRVISSYVLSLAVYRGPWQAVSLAASHSLCLENRELMS